MEAPPRVAFVPTLVRPIASLEIPFPTKTVVGLGTPVRARVGMTDPVRIAVVRAVAVGVSPELTAETLRPDSPY